METRGNYALIGAFVIVASLAIVGFVLWLGQSQFQREFDQYDIVFEGPVNLEQGASVRYIGIKVGEVESVLIDPGDASKVRARIRIDGETPVKTDSTASIEFAGITGVTFIQINAGSQDAPRLRPDNGEVARIQAEKTPLDELFSGGAEVMGRANLTLERVGLLLNDENVEGVGNIIANIETLSDQLASEDGLMMRLNGAVEQIEAAAESFDQAAQQLSDLGVEAEGQLAGIGNEAEALIRDVREVADTVDESAGEARRAISSAAEAIEGPGAETLQDARTVVQDLRSLIVRLDRAARRIEQDPQGLVRGDAVPYEEE